MAEAQDQGSEVARLLAQISAEYAAAKRGLTAFASGASQHAFISQKMENMGKLQEELQTLVGDMPAIAMIAAQLESSSDKEHTHEKEQKTVAGPFSS